MKCVDSVILLNGIILIKALILSPIREGAGFETEIGDGWCIVNNSRLESQFVPYTETYKSREWFFYKIRTRLNYRIEYHRTWVKVKKCCLGYEQIGTLCQPLCLSKPCQYGFCRLPDQCQCTPGYAPSQDPELKDHVCVVQCETDCANGVCSLPNICECNPGYQLTDDKLHCLPVCSKGCTRNAHCTTPGTCDCDSGYVRRGTENSLECSPECTTPCQNGKCTAPNICSCDDGYQLDPTNPFSCIPVCQHDCTYGVCTAPDTCTCMPGYRAKNDSVCEPICSEPCRMGSCIAPESCACEEGYGLLESSKYVCQPICEGCINGTCTAPGVCACNEGYRLNGFEEERICKPFCKIPCEPHGTCDAPDTCSCFEGYRMIDTSGKENEIFNNATEYTSACEPVCNRSCVHGKCIRPNSCSCDAGYSPSINDSNVCEPICETPCGPNSVCTEPNVCTCLPNHKLMENDIAHGCEPICEIDCGRNGTCTAPNVCKCNDGYAWNKEDRCTPVCNSTCQNSTCIGPNQCQCWKGFAPVTETRCAPFCKNGCENGKCVTPNECRCDSGFVKNENNSCVKPCSRLCHGHGVCVDDNRPCECFYGWTGWDCDQLTVCILLMDADDEGLKSVTVHNETNSTVVDARQDAPQCGECNQAVGNKSLCYAMPAVDGSGFTVGCLVETESCNRSHSAAMSAVTGTLSVLPIFFIALVSIATYFVIRRRSKQKMHTESITDEALLQEEEHSISEFSTEN